MGRISSRQRGYREASREAFRDAGVKEWEADYKAAWARHGGPDPFMVKGEGHRSFLTAFKAAYHFARERADALKARGSLFSGIKSRKPIWE